MSDNRKTSSVAVPSKDPPKKEEEEKDKDSMDIDNKNDNIELEKETKKKKKKAAENEEISKEDQLLKEKLLLLTDGVCKKDKESLKLLKNEIRSSTSSMTSVPKPLKYLGTDNYIKIKNYFHSSIMPLKKNNNKNDNDMVSEYADLMSILAMTMEDANLRMCLKYRLYANIEGMDEWGTQYMIHLVAEIRMEMEQRLAAEEDPLLLSGLISMDQIMPVVEYITKYFMAHNAEPDACDLLLEVERLDLVSKFTEEHNHSRVCEYLRSCAQYLPAPDDISIYRLCFNLYLKYGSFFDALRYALKLDQKKYIKLVMKRLSNRNLLKRQCAYLLGWHQYGYDDEEEDEEEENETNDKDDDDDTNMVDNVNNNNEENDDNLPEYEKVFSNILENGEEKNEENDNNDDDDYEIPEINEIIANTGLSEAFHNLARDLDVLDPKDPEIDVFKEQLIENVNTNVNNTETVISARKSLAISYVNAFVNAGFGRDKYLIGTGNVQTANNWIAKNKEKGQLASIASIGCIMLWDEEAVNAVDRYFESKQKQIRAGAFLAIGIACAGMRSESGVGLALLQSPALNDKDDNKKTEIERICAILGLGLAYAGQCNEEVYSALGQLITTEESTTISSMAALCLGVVYCGSCNSEISNLILTDLMEREGDALNNHIYLLNVLGLSLLFLGRQERSEVTMEACDVFNDINPDFCKTLKVSLECLAFAGTGNVLKIQKLLSIIGEHFEEEEKKETKEKEEKKEEKKDEEEKEKEIIEYRYFQSIAVLGISIIAFNEDLGKEMSLRMFNHLIQYGNVRVKRSVPLALAMISISNPQLSISDTLSKLSHDNDDKVSRNAILALGLIGAGTNNARIAKMLRALTTYYAKDPLHLYIIRIAQGLIHMGKGLLTINPCHSDRFLISKVAIAGILTVLYSSINLDETILGDMHYLLFSLVMAIKPRMLVTLNAKNLKPLITSVRVGQAVDVVGQAGKPKRITGFQTHETPVILGYGDRVELATDDYLPLSSVMEGFCILRDNPDSEANKRKRKKEKMAAKSNQ